MSATTVEPGRPIPSVGRNELWMVAQGAIRLLGVGGMMFLAPAHVLDQRGSPADAGAVMALAGALALTDPIVASVLAGWVASEIGSSSLATIILVSAGAAIVLSTLLLRSPDGVVIRPRSATEELG